MATDVLIRSERPGDFAQIRSLVERSFSGAVLALGDEADFIEETRGKASYAPELSLVAVRDDVVVGYVMIRRTFVDDGQTRHPTLSLGPLCTAEELRGKGTGAALVVTALSRAADGGHSSVFLVGGHRYYERFGFVPTTGYSIRSQHDFPEALLDNIMVKELIPGALDGVTGVVYL